MSPRSRDVARNVSTVLTVYVNGRRKRLYHGLKVKNAIGPVKSRAVREHRLIVLDADGNRVDLDGALYDGEKLVTTPTSPTRFADGVQRDADAGPPP